MKRLRTLLVLGRVSNLPTVWSNCLAAWLLGGPNWFAKLSPLLFAGASLLYLGGMYLNDAFDADFDLQYRRERPIPSGAISAKAVWRTGFVLLAAGSGCLFGISLKTGLLGVMLALCILVYDAVHKVIKLSPALMAGCRFLLYLVAASTSENGVTGQVLWCAIVLAAYIAGLGYMAARETTRSIIRYWPCCLLAAPMVLALLMNAGEEFKKAALISFVLGLWIARMLRYTFGLMDRNIGRTVSGLLAGIALVDLLAVVDVSRPLAGVFFGCFLLALLLQRFVPAT